jgi:hypothetical protein
MTVAKQHIRKERDHDELDHKRAGETRRHEHKAANSAANSKANARVTTLERRDAIGYTCDAKTPNGHTQPEPN